jgi:hypothetical protein
MKSLYTKALLSLVVLAVSMGLLLFAPAGTTQYWQAWVYLVYLWICCSKEIDNFSQLRFVSRQVSASH